MRAATIVWIAVGILVVFVLAYGAAYIYTAKHITSQGIQDVRISEVSLEGFTITANVVLRNEGIITLKVKDIAYTVVLNANGEQIGSGYSPGGEIKPGEDLTIPLETTISWKPSLTLAGQLLLGGETTATIRATATVAELGPIDVRIPIEQTVDLRPYVQQFVSNVVQRAARAIIG